MKAPFFCCLIASLALALCPSLYGSSQALTASQYAANAQKQPSTSKPLGYGTNQANYKTVAMSMIGWGLFLGAAIAILAGLVNHSGSVHSDSSDSSTTTTS